MLEQVLARAAFMIRALRRATRLAAVARDSTVDPRVRCCWILALSDPRSPVSFLASSTRFLSVLQFFVSPKAADTLGSVLTFKCSYLLKLALYYRKKEGLSEINARPTPGSSWLSVINQELYPFGSGGRKQKAP